ncbi:MAG: thioredoxin [Myxococcota bacterium]|jgi:thioredoxin 1|nr:thioredoxin [Myxococcota bacterium]
MLKTNLTHLESEDFAQLLASHDNVMVCCGRMGPMCLPVYDVMEQLRPRYPHVQFRDLWFDGPQSHLIRDLPEVRGFTGLPFTVYFHKGKVVAATSSIQTRKQVTTILDRVFPTAAATATTSTPAAAPAAQ